MPDLVKKWREQHPYLSALEDEINADYNSQKYQYEKQNEQYEQQRKEYEQWVEANQYGPYGDERDQAGTGPYSLTPDMEYRRQTAAGAPNKLTPYQVAMQATMAVLPTAPETRSNAQLRNEARSLDAASRVARMESNKQGLTLSQNPTQMYNQQFTTGLRDLGNTANKLSSQAATAKEYASTIAAQRAATEAWQNYAHFRDNPDFIANSKPDPKVENRVYYSMAHPEEAIEENGAAVNAAAYADEDDKAMYFYLWNTYGHQAADKFYDDYVLNKASAAKAADVQRKAMIEGYDKPFVSSVKSIGTNVISGVGLVDMFFQNIARDFGITNPNRELNYNSLAQMPSLVTDSIREGVMKNLNGQKVDDETVDAAAWTAAWLYQNFMSAADSGVGVVLTALGVPSAATLAIMAGAAGTRAIQDARKRGATDSEALRFGMLSAAAEAAFEKISLDVAVDSLLGSMGKDGVYSIGQAILKALGKENSRNAGTILAQWALNSLTNSFVEGSEELLTTIANDFSDRLIMGDRSEFEQKRQELLAMGVSDKEAARAALKSTINEALQDAAAGAFSGFLMGGGTTFAGQALRPIANTVSDRMQIARELTNYQRGAQQLRQMESELRQVTRDQSPPAAPAVQQRQLTEREQNPLQFALNKAQNGETVTGNDAKAILNDPQAVQTLRDAGVLADTIRPGAEGRAQIQQAVQALAEQTRVGMSETQQATERTSQLPVPNQQETAQERTALPMPQEAAEESATPPMPQQEAPTPPLPQQMAQEQQERVTTSPVPQNTQEAAQEPTLRLRAQEEQAPRQETLRLPKNEVAEPTRQAPLTIRGANATVEENRQEESYGQGQQTETAAAAGEDDFRSRAETAAEGARRSYLDRIERSSGLGRVLQDLRNYRVVRGAESRASEVSRIRNQAEAGNQREVSAQDYGLANGTADKTAVEIDNVTLGKVLGRGWTRAVDELARQGVTLKGITGQLWKTDGPPARAFFSGDGKTIVVQVDNPRLSWNQLLDHEDLHRRIKENPAYRKAVEDALLADKKLQAYLPEIIDRYSRAYAEHAPDLTSDDVIEELLADYRAGFDMLDPLGMNPITARAAKRAAKDIKSAEKTLRKQVDEQRPVSVDDEARASREFDSDYMQAAVAYNQTSKHVPDSLMNDVTKVRETIKAKLEEIQDEARLPADVTGNTYFGNGSYNGSEENTTVCPRSLSVDALADAVGDALGRPLTIEETVYVAQQAFHFTDVPQCLYCYVAMDRMAKRQLLGEYVNKRTQVLTDIQNGMSREEALAAYKNRETSGGKQWSKNKQARFERWVNDYESGKPTLKMSDLSSEAQVEKTLANPDLRAEAQDALQYAQNASWAKKRVSFTAYNNHILKWDQKRINALNSMFGLRMYSFSDFSPAFILENMQMVTDAAVRGLKMLAYTKELDFVRIFAGTGMNINISTFGMDGGDGKVHMDAMQGADWKEAQELRKKYPNVGVTFVATNDNQVNWALDQDWIDVVIPFHMVKTGATVADILGYQNYTGESSDKKIAGEKAKQKEIFPSQHQNNKEKYLAALEKAHLTPRFERWLDHPNYMKLVNETRRSAGDTPAVQPKFNQDAVNAALKSLDDMVKRGGYGVPIGGSLENLADIAEEMSDDIRKGIAQDLREHNRQKGKAESRLQGKASIETLPDGKKYVRADRQVIFGNDPDSWSEQLENYINGKIRQGKNVQLIGADGEVLTLTARTAGKISSPFDNHGGRLSDDEFERKVNAGAHIDELVQVSLPQQGGTKPDKNARHGNQAAGGWKYRDAYFLDFDGKYYECHISVQIGDDGNAVYNIGAMQRRTFPEIGGSSANGGAQSGKGSSGVKVAQTKPSVKPQSGGKASTEIDTDYLTAVNSGDMETAQRMVDEAAKKAGYTVRKYHQTDVPNIHVFDIGIGTHGGTDSETPYGIFTKNTRSDIGLGDIQMSLYLKPGKTFVIKDRSELRSRMPEAYNLLATKLEAIDEKYNSLVEEAEDALFDAQDAYEEKHPEAEVTLDDIVNNRTYDDPACQRANEHWKAVMAEWSKEADKIRVQAKEVLSKYLRDSGYDSMEIKLDKGTNGRSTDTFIVFSPEQVKSADPVTYDDNGKVIPLSQRFNAKNEDTRFSREIRPEVVDRLDKQIKDGNYVIVYHSLYQDKDGNLYSPMAGKKKVGDKWIMTNPYDLNAWYKSDTPENIADLIENGTVKLKDSGGWSFLLKKPDTGGTDVPAALNPWNHASTDALNDQFNAAFARETDEGELVTVESIIPLSEVDPSVAVDPETGKVETKPYEEMGMVTDRDVIARPDPQNKKLKVSTPIPAGSTIKAKDSVGLKMWKAGPVHAKISGKRPVYLSRWIRNTRVLSTEETAKMVAQTLKKEGFTGEIPGNVVGLKLRKALENEGVKFGTPTNKGYYAYMSERGYTKSQAEGEPLSGSASIEIDPEVAAQFSPEAIARRQSNRTKGVKGERKVSRVRSNTYEYSGLYNEVEAQMDEADEENYTYDPVSEKKSMNEALGRLKADFDGEVGRLSEADRQWGGSDLDTAMGILHRYRTEGRETGDYSRFWDWSKTIQEKGTKGGQFIQAFAKYTRTGTGAAMKGAKDIHDRFKLNPAQQKQVDAAKKKLMDGIDSDMNGAAQDAMKQAKGQKEPGKKQDGKVDKKKLDAEVQRRKDAERLVREISKLFEKQQNHGEPVENWLNLTGEELARKIAGRFSEPKQRTKTTMQTILSDLVGFAEEHALPDRKKAEGTKRTAIDIITDYLNNRGAYGTAWGAAQSYLRAAYTDDQEKLDALNSFLTATIAYNAEGTDRTMLDAILQSADVLGISEKRILELTSAGATASTIDRIGDELVSQVKERMGADYNESYTQQLKDAVRRHITGIALQESAEDQRLRLGGMTTDAARQLEINLQKLLTQSRGDKNRAAQSVAGYLIRELGIPSSDAAIAAERITGAFMDELASRADRKLQQMFAEKKPKTQEQRDRLLDLIRLGGLTNSNVEDAVVDALGIGGMSRERQRELVGVMAQFGETLDAMEADDAEGLRQLIREQAAVRGTRLSRMSEKTLSGETDIEYLRDFALAQLDAIAGDFAEMSPGAKISTFQTISHLLNMRTALRNLTSNQVFDLVDSAANNLATIPDMVIGAFTGKRTVGVNKSWLSEMKRAGAKQGAARNALEVRLDVSPDDRQKSKYGTAGRRTNSMAASNAFGRILSHLEEVMGYELNTTDEFHKGSVRGETLESLARFVERGDIAQEQANAWAEEEALYRAFQDDTLVGNIMGELKTLLNVIGFGDSGKTNSRGRTIHDFGLGDLVVKYTQVPGALIHRGIEYSPLGYAKMLYDLAIAKDSLVRTQRRGEDVTNAQRKLALDIGRATTGSGLITLFAVLAKAGLLRRDDDDKDKNAKAMHAAQGLSGTQLNLTALKRWIEGGDLSLTDGDVLADIGFLEPLDSLMTIATLMANDDDLKLTDIGVKSLDGVWKAISNTSAMQTISNIISTVQYHDEENDLPLYFQIPIEIASDSISGFVPSPVRQLAQATDTTYRDQYRSKNLNDQIRARVANSIPGLRQTLAPKITPLGEDRKYQKPLLNYLNATLNPGNINVYQGSGVVDELNRVYGETDDAKIWPERNAPYSFTANDEKWTLTPDERTQYQRTRGRTTANAMESVMGTDWYKSMGATDQAEVLNWIGNFSNFVAKKEMLESRGQEYGSTTYNKYYEAWQSGTPIEEVVADKYGKLVTAAAETAKAETIIAEAKIPDASKEEAETMSADAKRLYAAFLQGGVSDSTARNLATSMEGSEASGHEQWRMVYDAAGKEGEKAVTSVMTEDMKRNWNLAKDAGVGMDDYIKVREDFKDLNGNGNKSQDEWNATLDSFTFSSNAAKDKSIKGTLWQILTGSGSTKNNPYDKEAGQKVIDAKSGGGSGSGSYAPVRIPTLRIPEVPKATKPSSELRLPATNAAPRQSSGLRLK